MNGATGKWWEKTAVPEAGPVRGHTACVFVHRSADVALFLVL
jgi:hypothetical protein